MSSTYLFHSLGLVGAVSSAGSTTGPERSSAHRTTFRRKLEEDRTLGDRTFLSPEQIAELLGMCLKSTYFSYGESFYEQKEGAAMGSPVSAVVANLYMEFFRSWHWRRHRPDPGCGRGMLMTLSASSGRAQLKNSYTISKGSGRPSSSLWCRKRMGHSHSLTRYSGGERMAAWTSLSTGSPRTRTGIFTLSPIIRPT